MLRTTGFVFPCAVLLVVLAAAGACAPGIPPMNAKGTTPNNGAANVTPTAATGVQTNNASSNKICNVPPPTNTNFTNISASQLNGMLTNKDFILVNVHTPYAGEISNTDLIISYDKVKDNAAKFPADKRAKIVVYCFSGPMGSSAAGTLADMEYTNVLNLEGGMQAWSQAGFKLNKPAVSPTPGAATTPDTTGGAFVFSNLRLTPETINAGDSSKVTVTVTNTRKQAVTDNVTLTLTLDGGACASGLPPLLQAISLAPGASGDVSFNVTMGPGSQEIYTIVIGSLTRNLVVQ